MSVGYRVNSHRAIEFRKWATGVLHEYIIKGFAMDYERLKQIKHFGQDYFDEMLELHRCWKFLFDASSSSGCRNFQLPKGLEASGRCQGLYLFLREFNINKSEVIILTG